ncbi:MAG TPA: hypothetical protein IAB72_03315 [Candidatus Onthoplasma faecipullorum]|nr:hypothetical protein [Candidatus Onthoplasma faecipullorum]
MKDNNNNELRSTIEKFSSENEINELKVKNISEFIYKVIIDPSSIDRDELLKFVENLIYNNPILENVQKDDLPKYLTILDPKNFADGEYEYGDRLIAIKLLSEYNFDSFLYYVLNVVGHELTHCFQDSLGLDYTYNYIARHDRPFNDEMDGQLNKSIWSLIKNLGREKLDFFTDKDLDNISLNVYYHLPHERDARIGAIIFIDSIMRLAFQYIETNYPKFDLENVKSTLKEHLDKMINKIDIEQDKYLRDIEIVSLNLDLDKFIKFDSLISRLSARMYAKNLPILFNNENAINILEDINSIQQKINHENNFIEIYKKYLEFYKSKQNNSQKSNNDYQTKQISKNNEEKEEILKEIEALKQTLSKIKKSIGYKLKLKGATLAHKSTQDIINANYDYIEYLEELNQLLNEENENEYADKISYYTEKLANSRETLKSLKSTLKIKESKLKKLSFKPNYETFLKYIQNLNQFVSSLTFMYCLNDGSSGSFTTFEFLNKLVKDGSIQALEAINYISLNYNMTFEEVFDKAYIYTALIDKDVTLSSFMHLNLYDANDKPLISYEKIDRIASNLLFSDKIDYLPFVLPKSAKHISQQIIDALTWRVKHYIWEIEHSHKDIIARNYSTFLNILRDLQDNENLKSLYNKLNSLNDKYNELVSKLPKNKEKRDYYKIYGKKAGDYYYNVFLTPTPTDKETRKVISTLNDEYTTVQ